MRRQMSKLVNIRYAISLNKYRKYIATTIATNVSDTTVAEIMENQGELTGVSIEESSIRQYNNSKYFASIIGYTGRFLRKSTMRFLKGKEVLFPDGYCRESRN